MSHDPDQRESRRPTCPDCGSDRVKVVGWASTANLSSKLEHRTPSKFKCLDCENKR